VYVFPVQSREPTMKRSISFVFSIPIILFGLVATLIGQDLQISESVPLDQGYFKTQSPDGKIEAAMLMHGRMGIRVEMNLNKDQLDLWISPQAGKELSNRYRNFSCRDDHTSLFDQIAFPELVRKHFLGCDYDPFHSVLHFQGQDMHIATLFDQPVVLIWFSNGEVVDFKSDKQDSLLEQSPRIFGVRHPDRGLTLDFYAGLGGGDAMFQHQPEVMNYRSIYARAVVHPGDFVVIGGELSRERVRETVDSLAGSSLKELLDSSERKIAAAIRPGSLVLNGLPDIQKLYDINKRHMLSVQDASGALHAALRYVYYLIWITDGTVCASSMAQAGDSEFLRRWCDYILANPTRQDAPPDGPFYGQLVNEKITKREEFGSLCAVWPAFMYWGLTGSDQFITGSNLQLLKEVVDWVERYCWDPEMQAIGTYYIGGGSEDPFLGSNDYGYDAAVGSFMGRNMRYPKYRGKAILRAYEYNMNLNQYNMYLMLSSVSSGDEAEEYLRKANVLAFYLNKLDSLDIPAYYLLEDESIVPVTPGRNSGDDLALFAIQNKAPAWYMPDFPRKFMERVTGYIPFTGSTLVHHYATRVYGRLQGLDNEFMSEDDIIATMTATLPYHIKPSRYIPMPWSMVEYFGAEEGSFHDIRPQAFSTAPYIAALTNLSIRAMPFGIAVRGTKYVKEIRDFAYMDSKVNVYYSGEGDSPSIELNGKPLKYTLQIPDGRLKAGENRVDIVMDEKRDQSPCLVYSTIRLNDMVEEKDKVIYEVQGYSQNVLVIKHVSGEVKVFNTKHDPVTATLSKEGNYLFVEFWGKGEYRVEYTYRK
jgi:hypothetical protein